METNVYAGVMEAEVNRKVGIMGCGWLGLPLGIELVRRGYKVRGTTTSEEKITRIRDAGMDPYLVELSQEGIRGEVQDFLRDIEVLIVDIPPGRNKDSRQDYAQCIGHLLQSMEEHKLSKLLFVSSISVYQNSEHFPIYSEDQTPNAQSKSGTALIAAEDKIRQHPQIKGTILRLGGLIGKDRHPVHHLAGKQNLQDPLGPVNLIAQRDCIGILIRLVERNRFGELFHAVYPKNPSRQKYYGHKAQELGLEPPKFEEDLPSRGKVISSLKVMKELDYVFVEEI